jgi:ribosome-interacting GTPase 1
MPANVSIEYNQAEKEYDKAQTAKEKLAALEKLISVAPSHKGAENLRANLRWRYNKLKESMEKAKKSGKGTQQSIKKEAMQVCLVGFSNSGKSQIFNALTGLNTKVSDFAHTTTKPEVGMMPYEDAKIQLIDMPPLPNTDMGIINSADTLLLVTASVKDIPEIQKLLQKSTAEKIIIFNKIDLLTEQEKRKLTDTLKSKKYNFITFSAVTRENEQELRKRIFQSFPVIRVYTKEPKKEASKDPVILKIGSNIEDVADKIAKGFIKKVKKARIWGPSSKFGGQIVGIDHILKDKDVVEFQTS